VKEGWRCPKCGNIYAPNVSECKACNKPVVTVTIDYVNYVKTERPTGA
jgi:uncharacterized OB-fold protein